ncbi:MAG: TetR/AcrR family transcriptional regulator [Bacteroidales bacterium]|nr:TetR/AcrR family transcriptional regulator [Bacteroidales bacterium]
MSKERIIEGAKELFRLSGLKSTTMDDIAKHIGMSKRTIYENFKDKEEILVACLDQVYWENRRFSEKVFAESDNVIEATVILLRKGAEQARKQRYMIIEDIKKYYPEVYQNILLSQQDDKQKEMEALVEQGMKEGVFREDLNPEIIAYFFAQQAEGIAINDQKLDGYSLLEVFKNMVLSFIRGICTPKGLKIINQLTK